jgi:hypothetical protein
LASGEGVRLAIFGPCHPRDGRLCWLLEPSFMVDEGKREIVVLYYYILGCEVKSRLLYCLLDCGTDDGKRNFIFEGEELIFICVWLLHRPLQRA